MSHNRFPDQGQKIRFLMQRGDQHGRRFTNQQASLASALGIGTSQLSRIISGKAPLHDQILEQLCMLCDVRIDAFRTYSGARFIERYSACTSNSVEQSDWRAMVRMARGDRGRIVLQDPSARLRYPMVERPRELPKVPIEQPFWVEFDSDMHVDGKVPLWSGWHLMCFCHRWSSGGFKCYIPAYRNVPGYALETFPNTRRVVIPTSRGADTRHLKHDHEDAGGNFEWVLVVSKQAFPVKMREPFLDTETQDLGLEAGLGRLAAWLDEQPPLTTSIVKVAYQVAARGKHE